VGALSRPNLLSDLTLQFDAIAERRDAEHGPASVHAFEFAAPIRYLRALCRDLNRPYLLDLGCATGQTLLHLTDLIAGVGVDISPIITSRVHRADIRANQVGPTGDEGGWRKAG
jgi:SAM-dependent methyltransferase